MFELKFDFDPPMLSSLGHLNRYNQSFYYSNNIYNFIAYVIFKLIDIAKNKIFIKSYTPVLNIPLMVNCLEFKTGPKIVIEFPGILI